MRALLQTVEKVLDHDVNLLLLGESGSGKDYFAEAIHACGDRRSKPFVKIDCAGIPAELFESELFGFEKGTFTDAQSRKLGKLETVQGGTVYFDDIASLAPPLQAKLLRALDGRVISSSSVPAEELLAGLRRDLFYRINVVTLTIPPLRERREDIPRLAKSFLARRKRGIDAEAMRMLVEHEWPGNIRELRNVIERATLIEESDVITPASLPPLAADIVESAVRNQWTLDDLESRYIREVLRQTKSNYSRAAKILGINRKTLLEKRRRYGIE